MTDPIILAFDTSGPRCAAALLVGDRAFVKIEDMAKGQAEHLVPMLEGLLTAHDLTWQDLSGIGVGTGPGNFTGIRISIATARGLALGLGKPAIGVTQFEAYAYGNTNCVVALPAMRGQVYVQAFVAGGDRAPRIADAVYDQMPRYPGRAEPGVVGPAADQVGPLLHAPTVSAQCEPVEAIARIAASRLHDPDLARPAPLYLRSADAAPPRDPAPVILA
ncbi:tRNA (adenosine(37)-N6)-threonylcarbamoyltransferase complex dimerization subunit type 1 TsaB [Yoonia sp. 208BN28-4]|uniref:tRNA (adenosine(37)-N6)-threonylcarbamoyltransferase complex dimerization subunit type 1 TsaB n=1 Tax=Yoonia sp. 208BN28-4 TaxID=3126505 RepID=UPI0030990FC7